MCCVSNPPVDGLLGVSRIVASGEDRVLEQRVELVRQHAGKPKKVAIVACMRKLLTILNAMPRCSETKRNGTRPGASRLRPRLDFQHSC